MSSTPSSRPDSASGAPDPKRPDPKFIDSLWAFLIATAVLGPFALPLLWRNPRYKARTKILGSAAVLLFTWWLIHFSAGLLKTAMEVVQ